jgi:hypothetical protein
VGKRKVESGGERRRGEIEQKRIIMRERETEKRIEGRGRRKQKVGKI